MKKVLCSIVFMSLLFGCSKDAVVSPVAPVSVAPVAPVINTTVQGDISLIYSLKDFPDSLKYNNYIPPSSGDSGRYEYTVVLPIPSIVDSSCLYPIINRTIFPPHTIPPNNGYIGPSEIRNGLYNSDTVRSVFIYGFLDYKTITLKISFFPYHAMTKDSLDAYIKTKFIPNSFVGFSFPKFVSVKP